MSALLQSYISSLKLLARVECISIHVGQVLHVPLGSELLHDGESPVPELRDLDRARQHSLSEPAADQGSVETDEGIECSTSSDPACLLIRLEVRQDVGADPKESDFLGTERRQQERAEIHPAAWLGLRFESAEECSSVYLTLCRGSDADPRWREMLSLGQALVAQSVLVSKVLVDPTTGLPDRRAYQTALEISLRKAQAEGSSVATLLINPDEFVRINQLHGREAGDQAVRQIAEVLGAELRTGDHICRYGGVTFAVILTGVAADAATEVANRLLQALSRRDYGADSAKLSFSVGLACDRPGKDRVDHPWDLVRRADQALNFAKKSGGSRAAEWDEGSGTMPLESFDRLSGIFTGTVAKDYRNMVLLWDTVNVIATSDEVELMARLTVEKFHESLKPDYVGFCLVEGEETRMLGQVTRPTERSAGEENDLNREGAARQRLLAAASTTDDLIEEIELPTGTATGRSSYVLPLIAADERYGAICLEWWEANQTLDSSDSLFLRALGLQLAMACQRLRLAEAERYRQDEQQRLLQTELAELREVVRRTKLVYRSDEMERLMATIHRVADTDATILITGPSGTGKELLAHTIHELGARRKQPFVVVDCGAIPSTLIESELFGHERGAFTGAAQRRDGKLLEADRGTVLLDEIGELPLDVQSRLLRFVQDKVVTRVGGTKVHKVDVRILAATNRDLVRAVQQGNFREDLFHRLNVVRLRVPPLSARKDDVRHLARHFIELYSAQYHKGVRDLTEESKGLLLTYPWPGNVRELQNRIMRGVLLTEGDELSPTDLGLEDEAEGGNEARASAGPTDSDEPDEDASTRFSNEADEDSPSNGSNGSDDENLAMARLERLLGAEVDRCLGLDDDEAPPLGRWLRQGLVLAAAAATPTATEAATLLDIANTTYRRRLIQARSELETTPVDRGSVWDEVEAGLRRLAETARPGNRLFARLETMALQRIERGCRGRTLIGAQLLGVSQPTYRKRRAAEAGPESAR